MDVVRNIERQLPLKTNSLDIVNLRYIREHIRNLIPLMEEVY